MLIRIILEFLSFTAIVCVYNTTSMMWWYMHEGVSCTWTYVANSTQHRMEPAEVAAIVDSMPSHVWRALNRFHVFGCCAWCIRAITFQFRSCLVSGMQNDANELKCGSDRPHSGLDWVYARKRPPKRLLRWKPIECKPVNVPKALRLPKHSNNDNKLRVYVCSDYANAR